MASFADTDVPEKVLAEKAISEGLDPLFLRRQSLSEDLRRWAALEARLCLLEQTAARDAGLRGKQALILRTLTLEGGRMSVKSLLARLRLSKQNLHNSLTELVRAGYVRKTGSDCEDRRVRVLVLTERGVSFAEGLLAPRARLLRRAYRAADAVQVEGFRRTLLLLSEEGLS